MVELITPIAAAIICLIVLPCIGYLFIRSADSPTRADLQAHTDSDDRCFAEIRAKLDNLATKMDEQYRSLVSLYLTGKNGNGTKSN